jgi:hypothetical protein
MPRSTDFDNEWDDDESFSNEWDDEESSSHEWVDDASDVPTVPCPYCEREVPEDLTRCPYCEHYISREDAPPDRKPWWIIVGVVVCLLVVLLWIATF